MDEALFLDGLNAAQRAAVTSPVSVLQILAPPGSGKTKTLTSRVAYLLAHHQYKPWNTLCLTFTIKSAKEMKERICKLIGNALGSKLVLGTFHSVCRRYLVSYGYLIGIRKGFGIADSSDSLAIITRIIKRLKLSIDPKSARSRISSSKARIVGYEELSLDTAKKKSVDQQEFVAVFEAYESHLATSNLLDYDDLLLRCVDLLRDHPACVSNIEVVLIDEFQDTNLVQFELMRLFAAKHSRITTVGDPDQSIYGWRSAEIKNLKRMQKEYRDTLVVHLEDNYRSSGAILLAALEVIEQDDSRPAKSLLPTHCPGTPPVLRRLPSANDEASWIVTEMQRSIALTGGLLTYADFSVLLRSASLSRQIESAMGKAGIPYRMAGGQRFFDRIEVKILLDYLRVISQPENSDALARIINLPSRRIGDVTIRALLEEAASRKSTLWALIRDLVQGHLTPRTKITNVAEQGLAIVTKIILTGRKKMLDASNPHSPHQLLQYVIDKLEFKRFLEKTRPEDHEGRWANVEELMAQASDYLSVPDLSRSADEDDVTLPTIMGLEQESGNQAEEMLARFLANVALSTEIQKEEDNEAQAGPQERVTISTIHAAKGLEWPVVFIPSAYEGSIPHSRAEDTDEERRLLYVAMTRAQALLYLSCPMRNSMREETSLSPFLSTKKVLQYLVDQGSSFRFSNTLDISRILRRESPSEEALLDGLSRVASVEDDLWPLTGEEDPEVVAARWNSGGNGNAHGYSAIDRISKRRKLGVNASADQPSLVYAPSFDDRNPTGSEPKTTMQKFSLHTSGSRISGFVSAKSQLQSMQEEVDVDQDQRPKPTKRISGLVKAQNRDIEGSAGLMKYWGSSRGGRPPATSKSFVISSAKLEGNTGNGAIGSSASSETVRQMPVDGVMRDRASRPASASQNPLSNANGRPTMDVIPQSLATHSLRRSTTSAARSCSVTVITDSSTPYVFLSSSPPAVEIDPGKMAETSIHVTNVIRQSGVPGPTSTPLAAPGDSYPSSTCHLTSMAQVQARKQVTTKTLGVRRSVQGWSARNDQKLPKPRISGGSCQPTKAV
ncbi:hypothetical protein MMC19_006280 [Ptychographa xylographoides]|nr:hypothetical protein [Ptychographa xylographoides]